MLRDDDNSNESMCLFFFSLFFRAWCLLLPCFLVVYGEEETIFLLDGFLFSLGSLINGSCLEGPAVGPNERWSLTLYPLLVCLRDLRRNRETNAIRSLHLKHQVDENMPNPMSGTHSWAGYVKLPTPSWSPLIDKIVSNFSLITVGWKKSTSR